MNFIATCSNIQKVINSFQSRIYILKLQILEIKYIEEIIKQICIKENIILEPSVIKFILSVCNNSVRTVINYLEKFKLIDDYITYDMAVSMCTNISFSEFIKYTELCKNPDTLLSAIRLIYTIYDSGYSVMDILDGYFTFIKVTNLLSEEKKYIIIKLLCRYITIFYNVHEDEIELAIFTNNLSHILQN